MSHRERRKPDSEPAQSGSGRESDDPNGKFDRDLVKWTRMVAVLTAGLVFVGALQFGGALLGWNAVKSTAKDAKYSREISHRQLRAYVAAAGVTTFKAIDPVTKATAYAFALGFHNYGVTPAISFEAWVSVKYFDGGVPNALDITKPYNRVEGEMPSTVPPGANVPVAGVTVLDADVASASQNKGVILFWGKGDYGDVFNPTAAYPISFCLILVPTFNPTTKVFDFAPRPYQAQCNVTD